MSGKYEKELSNSCLSSCCCHCLQLQPLKLHALWCTASLAVVCLWLWRELNHDHFFIWLALTGVEFSAFPTTGWFLGTWAGSSAWEWKLTDYIGISVLCSSHLVIIPSESISVGKSKCPPSPTLTSQAFLHLMFYGWPVPLLHNLDHIPVSQPPVNV